MPIALENRHSARAQSGFTLIELMIIVTLIGVFAAIAIPSFSQFMNKSRTQSLNDELLALLQYARTSAVEQRTFVNACKETGAWTIKKTCESVSEELRRLDIPGNLTVTTGPTSSITFRYNGTASDTTLIVCNSGDAANGFTIDVKASGSIQVWPRGMKSSTASMTACE
ncbi:Fimbrial protein [Pseudomonas sp. Bi70]|uniref:GspH/FimT family pseudopilin n=1 Tax=Pseudomonas sp. Bi70 TaxID=2821127 RepID=UPI001E08A009|nr:GspH/FimT family pseudopilin [Pseudomonas sp. Bi70]CAH0282307.1 Fimbrial protein [Pseudomonas sp. Bi70]